MRIVDAHVHWFDKVNPYEEALSRSYLLEGYEADAQGYDVVGVVHIERHGDPADRVAETRWLRNLAGLGNTVPGWTEASFRPYVLEAIEIFGPDRCMFASNFPTDERDMLFADDAIRHHRLAV
jgi:predicted TIM-barrel fold metal-dependent hydrolase